MMNFYEMNKRVTASSTGMVKHKLSFWEPSSGDS